MSDIINIKSMKKEYKMGKITVPALNGVNISINEGEFVAIIGPSGSGKSTLMHIIGCLDKPTGGKYSLNTELVSEMKKGKLAQIRNKQIGRAIVNNPTIILADEPTGNLDTASGGDILSIFSDLNDKGHTIIIVTHDPAVAKRANRVINIVDGLIQDGNIS